jgi:hypothetical protein
MSDTTKDAVTDEQILAVLCGFDDRPFHQPKGTQFVFNAYEDEHDLREIVLRRARELIALVVPAQVQAEKDAKTAELHKMLANIMHDQTTAMQSALIEWKHGKGAEAGLQWIVNTLMGPGLLPDFDAEHGTNAQFWFDANQSQPMPKCFCGNPSHIGWMGQGFCCNAHYNEAKAKHDAALASSAGDQEVGS